MRVVVFARNFELSDLLRRYAESRLGLAVQRLTDGLSWAGVRLTQGKDERGEGIRNLPDRPVAASHRSRHGERCGTQRGAGDRSRGDPP
jgi:hypothetical protein